MDAGAVVSDVAASLVGGAGTVVESSAVAGTGAGVGGVTAVSAAAEAVGCLLVLAVGAAVVDVAMAADGVPGVAVGVVDGMTDSAVTLGVAGRGVRGLGGEVAPGTLDVTSEVVEVAVGDVAPVVGTCWVAAPGMWAVVAGASVETVVRAGAHEGDGAVVAFVEASTRPVPGCVVSVTGSTTAAQKVVEAGGALVEAVVADVSAAVNTGGGVTNFLVVVAGVSALEISAGDFVVVAVVPPGVPEVITGVDVTGRRDASVVEETRTLVGEDNSGTVTAVEVWTGVEVASTRGGSEVCSLVTGRVEASVLGRGAPVGVSGGDAAVAAGETVSSASGVEAEV